MRQKSCHWSKYCLKRSVLRLVLKAGGRWWRGWGSVTENERKRIPDLCSREAKGRTTMLFSFVGGDAKSSIIRRRAQRPRRDTDLDKLSQVLRGSASDDLIAKTNYFVFNSLFYGEPVQLLEKFGVFCSTRFKEGVWLQSSVLVGVMVE